MTILLRKKLLICPVCEARGIKSVLGELKNGQMSILRFHQGETLIVGESYTVICGCCGAKVYIKDHLKISQNNERTTINRTAESV